VVQGVKKKKPERNNNNNVDNDDDTIVTDNKSKKSNDSMDTITEVSQETMQNRVIIEMQETMKRMQEDQQKMI